MSEKLMTLEDFYRSHLDLKEGEAILDVRKPDEFAEAHIKGAINIPVDEVDQHVDKLKKYKTLYIHCKRGGRAKMAFETLTGAGLDNVICVHDAGMDKWQELGYPVEKN